jgi:hypothetical protein
MILFEGFPFLWSGDGGIVLIINITHQHFIPMYIPILPYVSTQQMDLRFAFIMLIYMA